MLRAAAGLIASLSLLACLGAPVAYWRGALDEAAFRSLFAAASLAWFVFATLFLWRRSS